MSASPREDLDRLAHSPRPRFVFVSHGFGGGVGRHVDDLARLLESDAEILLLEPVPHTAFASLRWLRAGESLALWFRPGDEWPAIEDLLRKLAVERIHFHHVHGLPEAVLDLPARLGAAHDVTLHDYFPACANYHLTDRAGRFCGGRPDCKRCLDAGPAQWPLGVDAWRARFAPLVAGAQRVIAPSHDAGRRLRDFFPQARVVVWPHPEDTPAARTPLRVLVPGAISPEKGLALLEACVADAARRSLPLHFRVLGYTARPIASWPEQPYSVAGEYPEGRLPELLALERGDVAFFPAQCAETFSYTLSACLAAGMPIVATDLGALPERLAHRGNARILPWSSDAGAVNDALMESAPAPAAHRAAVDTTTFASYRDLYMAGIPVQPRTGVDAPAIEARWTQPPPPRVAPWTLAALFDDAVGCGRASSRDLLKRKAHEADIELAQARARAEEPRRVSPLHAIARLFKR